MIAGEEGLTEEVKGEQIWDCRADVHMHRSAEN